MKAHRLAAPVTEEPPAESRHMKTDGAAQTLGGRKQSLIEDARRERIGSSSAGPSSGPSRFGDGSVFEEKDGRVTLNVLFALSNEKNAGFFQTGKIFEVISPFSFNLVLFFVSFSLFLPKNQA